MKHPELAKLLRRRLGVIADHAWRERDPAGQLAALQEVSESIDAWYRAHRRGLDSRLAHFLTGASFSKALAYLESGPGPDAPRCGGK